MDFCPHLVSSPVAVWLLNTLSHQKHGSLPPLRMTSLMHADFSSQVPFSCSDSDSDSDYHKCSLLFVTFYLMRLWRTVDDCALSWTLCGHLDISKSWNATAFCAVFLVLFKDYYSI